MPLRKAAKSQSRSFLMPPLGEALGAETVIDISHESLMRVWQRLNAWADEEAQSAQTYRGLTEAAALHAKGQQSLWRDPELQLALDWRDNDHPNETWATRYHPGFASAMDFLARSGETREAERAERQQRRERELAAEQERAAAQARYARRMRWAAMVSSALALAAVIAAVVAGWAFLRARDAQVQATAAQKTAIVNESRALSALSQAASSQGRYTNAVKLALATWPRFKADERPRLLRTVDALGQALTGPQEVVPPLDANFLSLDPVWSAAFSPDGERVVTASNDKTARMWDAATGEPIGKPMQHDDWIYSAAFSPDGARVVTASKDKTARMWIAPPIAPNIVATACKMLGANHDIDVLWTSYGVKVKDPICQPGAPAPDPSRMTDR